MPGVLEVIARIGSNTLFIPAHSVRIPEPELGDVIGELEQHDYIAKIGPTNCYSFSPEGKGHRLYADVLRYYFRHHFLPPRESGREDWDEVQAEIEVLGARELEVLARAGYRRMQPSDEPLVLEGKELILAKAALEHAKQNELVTFDLIEPRKAACTLTDHGEAVYRTVLAYMHKLMK